MQGCRLLMTAVFMITKRPVWRLIAERASSLRSALASLLLARHRGERCHNRHVSMPPQQRRWAGRYALSIGCCPCWQLVALLPCPTSELWQRLGLAWLHCLQPSCLSAAGWRRVVPGEGPGWAQSGSGLLTARFAGCAGQLHSTLQVTRPPCLSSISMHSFAAQPSFVMECGALQGCTMDACCQQRKRSPRPLDSTAAECSRVGWRQVGAEAGCGAPAPQHLQGGPLTVHTFLAIDLWVPFA